MPATGQIRIKNTSGSDQTHLRLEYGGTLDRVRCKEFNYVCWGSGRIDLTDGTVAKDREITLEWDDFQGRGPTWKGSPHWVTGTGGKFAVEAQEVKPHWLPGAFEG